MEAATPTEKGLLFSIVEYPKSLQDAIQRAWTAGILEVRQRSGTKSLKGRQKAPRRRNKVGEQGKACIDCNGYWQGVECRISAFYSKHELYKTGQDCWHPKGTALAWNEVEEKQGYVQRKKTG